MKNLAFLSLIIILTCGSLFAQSANTNPVTDDSGQIYEIGDTGPAGGTIFYDRGSVEDGWRYRQPLSSGPIPIRAGTN